MPYQTILPMMEAARDGGYAVPAFNILNHLTARSIIDMCVEKRSPVILQTSVATVKQYGSARLAEFLIPMAKNASIPVAIHLDHCRDTALAKQCVEAGWSSVMIDRSDLPLAENIRQTREVVEYARARNVSVEGELGAVTGVEDDIAVEAEAAHLAGIDDSLRFVEETEVDVFAPAIGTAHGFYKKSPNIEFDLFGQLRRSIAAPLVIHGGTGLGKEVFQKLISLGAAKINISSALKEAYLQGAASYLDAHAVCNALEMDRAIMESVRNMAEIHIEIFGSAQKA